jgi:hypothetical protein
MRQRWTRARPAARMHQTLCHASGQQPTEGNRWEDATQPACSVPHPNMILAFLQHSISSFTISEGSVSSLTAVSSQCSQEFV